MVAEKRFFASKYDRIVESRGAVHIGCISTFLAMLLLCTSILGLAGDINPNAQVTAEGSFALTVENQLVTLHAEDAPLSEVLEALGQQTDTEIFTDLSDRDRISVQFQGLTLREALRELSTNTVYEWSATKEGEELARIYVLRAGSDKTPFTANPTDRDAGPGREKANKPFEFEFDPSAHEQKTE